MRPHPQEGRAPDPDVIGGLRLATLITDLTISVTTAKTRKVGELRGAQHDSRAEMEGRVTFRRSETATTTVLPRDVTSCVPTTWGRAVFLFAFMCVAATAVELFLLIHLSVVCFVAFHPAVTVSHCISVA